jgi:hypothetical protein
MAALVVWPGSLFALDVRISGSFIMNLVSGTPGVDLRGIVDHENSWSILLHDVQRTCEMPGCITVPPAPQDARLQASSFSFQFTGPDATILNSRVARDFSQGGLPENRGFFEINSAPCVGQHGVWLSISPPDPTDGVAFRVFTFAVQGTFPLDVDGCPIPAPFALNADQVILDDQRAFNNGSLWAISTGEIALQVPDAIEQRPWAAVKSMYR